MRSVHTLHRDGSREGQHLLAVRSMPQTIPDPHHLARVIAVGLHRGALVKIQLGQAERRSDASESTDGLSILVLAEIMRVIWQSWLPARFQTPKNARYLGRCK